MFQLAGRTARLDVLQDGYAILRLRRENAGLLGPEVKILVPPLVMARDGEPASGDRIEVGAQSTAETGMDRREPDCLLVARYIWQGGDNQADRTDQDPQPDGARFGRASGRSD